MTSVRTRLAACTVSLVVVATASSAVAKDGDRARQSAQGWLYLSSEMNGERERALRTCNDEVAPWNNRDWQSMQIIRYNGCMVQRAQMP